MNAAAGCGAQTPTPDVVDVVLDLDAQPLFAGYEEALFAEVSRLLPWFARIEGAGIHPLRCTAGAGGELLVARRAKLVLRIPREKVCAASLLEGARLTVGASRLELGHGTFRRLAPSATLYSPRVVTPAPDEAGFLAAIESELTRLGVRGRLLCGRPSRVVRGGVAHAAWGLAVHDLQPAASLLLQRAGLGGLRELGCGIMIPHKTIQTSD